MESLFAKHSLLIRQTSMGYVRNDIAKIKWNKQLLGIKGSRGIGKSTLIRQYIKRTYGTEAGESLYCVADGIYFSNHTLLELAEKFHAHGGQHLFIDEIHKYVNWSRELKEINDLYPDLKVTFSGSSLLDILNADADLSRRALSFRMYGLSFREFLNIKKGIQLQSHTLDEILSSADEICAEINDICHPLQYFDEYLKFGYFPFYDGDSDEYHDRLENVVNYIIEQELPMIQSVDIANIRKIKAMLLFLSDNVPYEVNIAKLSSYLQMNKLTVLSYLSSLHRAELITLLYSDINTVGKMQKPNKILMHDTNLLSMLNRNYDIRTMRECFAVNQLTSTHHTVEYAGKHSNFRVDGDTLLEICEKCKNFTQIAGIPNSYIFADEMDYPIGKKLPLYMLGFMY